MMLTPAWPLTLESSESVSGVIAQVDNGNKTKERNTITLFIALYLHAIIIST
jgi:hypothetical protein